MAFAQGGNVRPLTDEQLLAVLEADAEYETQDEAAKSLGLSRSTFKKRLYKARNAAAQGRFGTSVLIPGFEITKSTDVYNPQTGEIERQFTQQKPRRTDTFELPEGHTIKGISALVDGQGRVGQQWIKTKAELSPEDAAEAVKRAFDGFQFKAPSIITPASNDDRLVVYPFTDWHVGMFAYGKETDGDDWDLSIAERVITQSINDIVEQAPVASHAIILGLGDLMHIDDDKSRTPASGNILDSDTRYSKVLEKTTDLVIHGIELARRKHANVEVVIKRGNHDPNSMAATRHALRLYYRDTAGVTVDESPSPFYVKPFGVNMIAGFHGDGAKPADLPLLMATKWPDIWAKTKTRHCHTGHRHHNEIRVKEYSGAVVYTHRAPIPTDAYHAQHGYASGRAMQAYLYDRERGFRSSVNVEIE